MEEGDPPSYDEEIKQMVSREHEKITLNHSIFPLSEEYDKQVEKWLKVLEKEMKASVHRVMCESLKDYPESMELEGAATDRSGTLTDDKRIKWIGKWQS